MKSYILILISALSLGIVNLLYKKSTLAIGPVNTTFFYYAFGTLFSFLLWGFFRETGKVEAKGLILPAVIGLLLCVSIITFNLGLTQVKLSIASTIRSFAFLFSVLLAFIFLKDHISIKQVCGIGLAVVSLYLLVSK